MLLSGMKERIAEHQENMKFCWGGSGEGHAKIKVKTHQNRQKNNYKSSNKNGQTLFPFD
jgi:hypothetical protein